MHGENNVCRSLRGISMPAKGGIARWVVAYWLSHELLKLLEKPTVGL